MEGTKYTRIFDYSGGLPQWYDYTVVCIYIYVHRYAYIVAKTKEFSKDKVLNIANVELLNLKLHLLLHVVTLCFTYADDDDDLQTV